MTRLMALALPMLFVSGASLAGGASYAGNWPLTVSDSQYTNGTYCLEVNNNGLAYLVIDGETLYGTYRLLDGQILVTNETQGGEGQNDGLVFVAKAKNGNIGNGVYDDVADGEALDSGKVAFGTKGGC